MSRAYDFVVMGVILIISVTIHMMSVELFATGSTLHRIASGATLLNGAARADLWYEILALWVPLGSSTGIMLWGFIREYRRSRTTARRGI